MSIQDIYQAVLIELNKVKAPSLLLEDFCYFYNKGVLQYINFKYNIFETSLQLTDDLRVLLKTDVMNLANGKLVRADNTPQSLVLKTNVYGANYTCTLPDDYLHILNCICEFEIEDTRCGDKRDMTFGASKLDTSQWSSVINNYYMLPSMKRPYFYIINIDDPNNFLDGTRVIDRNNNLRYGNTTVPVMLIKCGKGRLKNVYIDYLRTPQYIKITQEDLDKVGDQSAVLEFPDYVMSEIVNKIVAIILENQSNPRLLTHNPVNQSIIPIGVAQTK